jgi:Rieske Fe-S protein
MRPTLGLSGLLVCAVLVTAAEPVRTVHVSFERGDLFVSLEPGPVQWYLPDGTLRQVLLSTVPGTGEGMGFDPSGNLYVTRWCTDPGCTSTGNTVEMFNVLGQSLGAVGGGYDCSPHDIVFKPDWTAYVGQAGCTGDVLRFTPGTVDPDAFDVAPENQGSFWIDMAADGCTLFYTSMGSSVKRFDTCTGTQLADFNAAPLPGVNHDLRVLPDGGVLVSSGEVIARLEAGGALVQTYAAAPGEPALWAGLDLAGDGTFWAANYFSSNIHRFALASGARLQTFSTNTPPNTAVAVVVMR